MTQVHLTLNNEEVQSIIQHSVKDDVSKNILTTVFNQLMENQRTEKALLASMLEMYVSGVSTRKVSKIVEELCGKSVSKSFVSSLTEQLDPMVNEWQNRSLSDTNYPYLMTDVLYIKIREDNRVLS